MRISYLCQINIEVPHYRSVSKKIVNKYSLSRQQQRKFIENKTIPRNKHWMTKNRVKNTHFLSSKKKHTKSSNYYFVRLGGVPMHVNGFACFLCISMHKFTQNILVFTYKCKFIAYFVISKLFATLTDNFDSVFGPLVGSYRRLSLPNEHLKHCEGNRRLL